MQNFPPDAKDLVSRLLKMDPESRLGAGSPQSENSMAKLKAHIFFKGVDFENLHLMEPPIDYENLTASTHSSSTLSAALDVTSDDSIRSEIIAITKSPVKVAYMVIKEGVIEKKCGWFFFKRRKVCLTSQPLISYYEADTNIFKVTV